jgi:hypothetical protein
MQTLDIDKALLLEAAFTSGERAERAWRRWQDVVRMDDIDAASQRALPQFHIRKGAGTSTDPRVQGLHRRAWYSNKLLFEHVKPLLERLRAGGVRVLTTRQSALVVKARDCYPLDRFHLTVAGRDFEKTLAAFRETGWSHRSRQPQLAEAALRGLDFECGRFLVQLDFEPLQNDAFWNRTERIETDGQVFEVPGLVDRLHEAAAPRRGWHRLDMYQRLLETLLVLHYAERMPDWALLARIAAAAGSALPLADVLEYLEHELGVGLPTGYLATLRTAFVTPLAAQEYRLSREASSIWRRLCLGRLEYLRLKETCAAQGRALSRLDYLKLRWNVRDVRGLVGHLASKMIASKRASGATEP